MDHVVEGQQHLRFLWYRISGQENRDRGQGVAYVREAIGVMPQNLL